VSNETYVKRIERIRPAADDILYSREGGVLGIACRVPANVELCLGQRMMLIRAGNDIRPAFLELVLNSPLITNIAKIHHAQPPARGVARRHWRQSRASFTSLTDTFLLTAFRMAPRAASRLACKRYLSRR
jgi:hypothetical protein